METKETMYERCCKVMPPVAGRYTTLGVVKGEGSYLYGEDGKKYLDFASGVAVCNLGHNHPAVVKAAKEQIDKLIHAGHNVVYYESYVELAEKLVELTGGDTMVYFSNSGAEANEGALKLAKYVTKRPAVISFKGSYHGNRSHHRFEFYLPQKLRTDGSKHLFSGVPESVPFSLYK